MYVDSHRIPVGAERDGLRSRQWRDMRPAIARAQCVSLTLLRGRMASTTRTDALAAGRGLVVASLAMRGVWLDDFAVDDPRR